MLELAVLALINQIANVGFGPLVATRVMAANPLSIRALVTDTATADRVVARVPALARPGVQLLPIRSLRLVQVDVRIRGRDAVRLTWTLTPRRGTTEVDLAAQAHSRGLAVRVALLFGGRRLIARRLDSVTTMTTIHETITIDARPDRVWTVAGDPATIERWVPALTSSGLDGDERLCTTVDCASLLEHIVEHNDSERYYVYEITESPMRLRPIARSSR